MRIGTKLGTIAGGLALATVPLVMASAPSASAASLCVSNHHGAEACFNPKTDNITVHDLKADGYSAVAHWETQYGLKGNCINSKGFKGKPVTCNYSFKPGKIITIWAVNVDYSSKHNTTRFWSAPEKFLLR